MSDPAYESELKVAGAKNREIDRLNEELSSLRYDMKKLRDINTDLSYNYETFRTNYQKAMKAWDDWKVERERWIKRVDELEAQLRGCEQALEGPPL